MNAIRRYALSALDAWVDLGVFRPFLMLGIWLGLVAIAATGLSRVRIETSGDSILDKASPLWARYQRSLELFGNDEVIVAAVAGREPYDPAALRLTRDASRSLESVPGVRRVDSVSTLPIIEVIGANEVRLNPALDSWSSIDEKARAEVRRSVDGNRIASRNVVSEDGRVFAINIWPDSGIENSYEVLVERIRRITGSPAAWVSGVPVFRTEVNLRTRRELGIFVPVTVAVMVLLLFIAFRSCASGSGPPFGEWCVRLPARWVHGVGGDSTFCADDDTSAGPACGWLRIYDAPALGGRKSCRSAWARHAQ